MSSLSYCINTNIFRKIQIKHLIYLCIFCVGAAIRVAAIYKNPITDQEASILLNVFKDTPDFHNSPLIDVIVKVAFFFFGQSVIPARMGSALAGSLILLTPWLYEKYWGQGECINLSFLFAIDPFLISNAIQLHGNSYALLFLLIAISMFMQDKFLLLIFSVFIMLLSGRYAVPLILFTFAITYLIIFPGNREKQKVYDYFREKGERLSRQINDKKYYLSTFFLIVLIVLILTKTAISSLFHPLVYTPVSINKSENYQPGLNLIALFSYFPLGLIGYVRYLLKMSSTEMESGKIFTAIFLIVLLFITLVPTSSVLDLVWASIPLSFLLSKQLPPLFQAIVKHGKEAGIWIVIVLAIFLVLILFALKYISPHSIYNNYFQTVVAVVLALIILLMVIIFMSYIKNFSFAKNILIACSIWIFITFQISIAWKSAGFGMNPEMEILWPNGYFKDHNLINDTVRNTIEKKYGTTAAIRMLNISATSSAFEWEVERYTKQNIQGFNLFSNPLFIITESGRSLDEDYENYLGQEFVVNEKPLWINAPIKSIVTKDYWSWLIYRISPPIQKKNVLWVSKELFPNLDKIGDSK